jgi:hypothetical protein
MWLLPYFLFVATILLAVLARKFGKNISKRWARLTYVKRIFLRSKEHDAITTSDSADNDPRKAKVKLQTVMHL